MEFGLKKCRLYGAFTLIELLVVIAIIGILAALLLPALSGAKNKGLMMTDVSNLRQQALSIHLYASDIADSMPWPNWLAGDVAPNGAARQGWLYTMDTNASGSSRFKVKTGLFWSYLKSEKMYRCPMDYTNAPLFSLRGQQVSSYAMNGAVVGYNRIVVPTLKLGVMNPDAVAFWETDEEYPGYFNDGANYPAEGVSLRHLRGAVNSRFDGSASFIKFDIWYDQVAETNKNQLWCYPESDNGR